LSLISEVQAETLKEECVSWALSHGLLISGNVSPITLLPTQIPRVLLKNAIDLATLFNELVHNVSLDTDFIFKKLESVDDDFTKRLVNILKEVTEEGVTQKIALGIHRSDYMIHLPHDSPPEDAKLLQVEINTISSAFGGLGSLVSKLHRYMIERFKIANYELKNLVENHSTKGIADALALAKALYHIKDSVILMVVNKGEDNSTDQRLLEYKLWEDHSVSMIRRSLTDIAERGVLNETTKELKIDDLIVAVCYYRSGYKPEDYPTQKEWYARKLMERSLAIKCPNINYHLVGTKKMQQVLSNPGMVEKFIHTESHVSLLRDCFAGQYSLDEGDNPEEIIKKVLSNPSSYVMKPQREGGGNLLYDTTMTNALTSMSPQQRAAYIIMDKIVPKSFNTYVILKNGSLAVMDAISELGIYGVFFGEQQKNFP